MKLEYKILWLDDKKSDIISDDFDKEIIEHLEDKNFIPKIDLESNEKDFLNKLNSSEYDLILTDFNLNEGDRDGKQIVEEIRKKSIFTEIMFYSAQGSVIDTNKLDRITFLDTSKTGSDHYPEVIDKAKKLIDLTIRKFEHIVVMRGLIMHETSSLDVMMDKYVKDYIHGITNDEEKEEFLKDIFTKIEKNAKEKYEKAQTKNHKKILNDNVLFSASQKIMALGKILQILGKEDFSEDYKEEIIKIRNQFAHAEIFINEQGKEYFKVKIGGKEEELIFDENLCKDIRKNINKHKNNIESL